MPASVDEWWPRLSQEARDWLVANNGDVLSASVAAEIVRAGGVLTTDAERAGENGTTGTSLPDDVVDWIDEVANGEVPGPRGDG